MTAFEVDQTPTLAICIPVFNDWTSASLLLARLDELASGQAMRWDVLFVDDGSTEPFPSATGETMRHLRSVKVLRLRRNLGHQRAIAIALAHLHEHGDHHFIAVMDGDGEDDPAFLTPLLERCKRGGTSEVVFAQRVKRSEGLAFRVGYWLFRVLHRLLVGRKVEVGNFSVVPRTALARLVGVSELWNHYAASVFHARLPTAMIPVPRAKRLAGQSKMNVVSLATHGLTAISVYSEVVGVRALLVLSMAMLTVLFAAGVVVAIRLFSDLSIPGWATTTFGLLILALINLATLCTFMGLFALRARTDASFVPLRDYHYYVLELLEWSVGSRHDGLTVSCRRERTSGEPLMAGREAHGS